MSFVVLQSYKHLFGMKCAQLDIVMSVPNIGQADYVRWLSYA